MELLAPDTFRGRPLIRRVHPADLAPDFQGGNSLTRLDWVGRNHGHGRKQLDATGWNTGLSNFLYVDGHVETKSIRDTVQPNSFEWGDKFYSWSGGQAVAP